MQAEYGDQVQFFVVYCREAHAIDSDRPNGTEVEQPVSTEERRSVAVKFLEDMKLEIPALLDNIDDKTSRDYASSPDRLYLVGKDGKIAYAGDKGPRGFKPDELETAIQQELGGFKKADSGRPQRGSEQVDARAQRVMMMPAIAAINKDGDDKLSPSEIEAAPKTLLSLDKNGDGELTADEMRPSRRGGRGR